MIARAFAALLLTLAGCEPQADGRREGREGNVRNLLSRQGEPSGKDKGDAARRDKPEGDAAPAAPEAEQATGGGDPRSPAVPGSAQRRAILDALRPAVEARLGPNVEFVVDRISVAPGWALVYANPQRRGGAPIDGRAIFGDGFEMMDGLTVTAILRFQGGRWTLVDHAIGATDVWYCDGRTGAPSSLTGC